MYAENLNNRLQGEYPYPVKHLNDTILRQEFQNVIDQYVTPEHFQYRNVYWMNISQIKNSIHLSLEFEIVCVT
jgi:hypothetical protein